MAQDLIASSEYRVIVGLGVTGMSCARHLHRKGVSFSVVDTRHQPPGLEQFRKEMPDITVYAGDYPVELINSASELIVSPGVAIDEPLVANASEAGVQVVGDIDLFVREAKAPIIGITGSNAKSTVTELVGDMARRAEVNVRVGGNLGTPALDLLDEQSELYVLELSSFQLERAGKLGLAVATVLNVSADHLDRHGNMPRYHQAKHRIFMGCSKAVAHSDDPLTVPLLEDGIPVVSWRLGEPALNGYGLRKEGDVEYLSHGFELLMPVSELAMAGRHNMANALAALAIGHAAGLSSPPMLDALRHFSGLPHRCERVAVIEGVSFVDDSKGTNVGATNAALAGLGGEQDIILIAGGQGKGADFRELRAAVQKHCKHLVLIGEDAPEIEAALADLVEVTRADSMQSAVASAAAIASNDETVLLSPACASFDMYTGYVARGEAFVAAVGQLGGRA
ncbi:MAG: UDP-N-acetylmuramoyl-L-alanine--D-glutamate ligase [Halioglobus sp.]